ncbi:hypothetical protein MNBD_GAMMA21-2662 [hydrothermal vent metagenome]|uniref:Mut7-C RNAse domain-containing protein n=1 Tax=hydrothermal vent metagenome TaxID=652676 RepID=A0A3B1ABW3_9ZZZZ
MTLAEPKFLVDSSLHRLGRWLRTAGYNSQFVDESMRAEIALNDGPVAANYYLLRQAIDNGRFLLTSSPEIDEMRRARGIVLLIESDNLEDCVEELGAYLTINWHFRPFTRCTVCNTELNITSDKTSEDNAYCPSCKQVFWDVSLTERMRSQLDNWYQKYSY